MTDPVTRLSISHTHSLSVIWMIMLAFVVVIVYFYSYFQLYCCLFGAYPHFRDFHTSLCGLLLVWTPPCVYSQVYIRYGFRCALEPRVVEICRVSGPLRRIQCL